jgi:N-acetylglucosamine malate deacetylase 1
MSFIKSLKYLRRYAVRLFIKTISTNSSLSNRNVVIVAPHPDDEVFACGGLIAYKKTKNVRVRVIFLTDGESSHMGCCNTEPEKIALARQRLAVESGKILGLEANDMSWLGLSDGFIPCKGGKAFATSVERLLELFQSIKPQEVYAPYSLDCWPDHEASSEIVRSALLKYKAKLELYYYPIWMWHNLPFRKLRKILNTKILRVDIRSFLGKKKAAIEHYLSASNPDCGISFCGNLPDGFVEHFQYDYEIYFKDEDQG